MGFDLKKWFFEYEFLLRLISYSLKCILPWYINGLYGASGWIDSMQIGQELPPRYITYPSDDIFHFAH
jgi:hypothetical protein